MNRTFYTIILGAGLSEIESDSTMISSRANLIKLNISNQRSAGSTVLVINKSLTENFKKIIDIDGVKILEVERNKGALASAAIAASVLNETDSILILPLESLVDPNIINNFVNKMTSDGMVSGCIVFKSNNSNFSYVRNGPQNEILEIAEKRIIGNLATTGIFYFSSKEKFLEACSWSFTNNVMVNNQFYLAPILNYFILKKDKIGYLEILEDQYFRFSNASETQQTIERMENHEQL
jgi:hypothetical protein